MIIIKQEAITSALRPTELAKEVQNIDVVKLNDKSIKEWKEKM